jgi:hypothetical protein
MSLLSQFFPSGSSDLSGGLAKDFSGQIPIDIVVIGGGGGAGGMPTAALVTQPTYQLSMSTGTLSGGGGGGRVFAYEGAIVDFNSVYPITVGAGGAINSDGGTSCFGTIVAKGGGNGGGFTPDGTAVAAGYNPEDYQHLGGAGGGGNNGTNGIAGGTLIDNTLGTIFGSKFQSTFLRNAQCGGTDLRSPSCYAYGVPLSGNGGFSCVTVYNALLNKWNYSNSLTNVGDGGGGAALASAETVIFSAPNPQPPSQYYPSAEDGRLGANYVDKSSTLFSPPSPGGLATYNWSSVDYIGNNLRRGISIPIGPYVSPLVPVAVSGLPVFANAVNQPSNLPLQINNLIAPVANTNKQVLYTVQSPSFNGNAASGHGGAGGIKVNPSGVWCRTFAVSFAYTINALPSPSGPAYPDVLGTTPSISTPFSMSVPGIDCQGGAGGSGSVWVIYPSDYADATVTGNTPVPSPPAIRVYRWDGAGTIKFNAS